MDDLINRIKEIKKLHQFQFNQLDLNLETSPRDSRYSQQLLEMMKKEEIMLSREPTSPATRSLTQKVDEALQNETQKFFAKLAAQNIRKWELFRDKLKRERSQLLQEISSKQLSNQVEMSPIDLEAERLQADYYKNWLQYEGLHLNNAFQSQLSRIDNDWSVHEQSIHQEYGSKKAAILGISHTDDIYRSDQRHDDGRWQHPEKQKTLIHTAPVFTPVRPSSAQRSHNSKKKENLHNAEVIIWCNDFVGLNLICLFTAGKSRKRIQGSPGISANTEK